MFRLFFSAVKTKLLWGIYGPLVAASHNSGLGRILMGVSPVTFRVFSAIAKHERAAPCECARPVAHPSMACLACVREVPGPQRAPLASPQPSVLTPSTAKFVWPSTYWWMWHGPNGLEVSEQQWLRVVRVQAAAPGRTVGTSSLTPLCTLEGGQPLPPGLVLPEGTCIPPLLCQCCQSWNKC